MSLELPQRDDYARLFLTDTPMLDVRAPVEYEQGAFPVTHNLPIINDDERQAIGLCYKQRGQDSAVELGHQLVSGEIKTQRVNAWLAFVEKNPQGALYCFRGGMRSKITQKWIYDQSGIVYPRIKGGYKAMRNFLIKQLDVSVEKLSFIVLSGRTGVGKSQLLHKFVQQVDLEGIYRHYGSAFGRMVQQQPSQIAVENELSIALMKLRYSGYQRILVEDESANIGSRRIPNALFTKMAQSPVVVLESPLQARVELIYQQYVLDARQQYQHVYGVELGTRKWADNLLNSLSKVERRLGGVRYKEVKAIMDAALSRPNEAAMDEHYAWISFLLTEYYDAMYDYQLAKKAGRVLFRGNEQAVCDFLCQMGFNQ